MSTADHATCCCAETLDDENFDLRACQKAGIDDPYAVGLLLANREEARRIAEGKL